MFLDDLIEKYRPKYGDEWAVSGFPQTRLDKIRQAIEDRDLEALRLIIFEDNAFSREIFEILADTKLGKTQKVRLAQLRQFVGEEACQLFDRALQETKSERDQMRAENFIRQMHAERTQYDGKIVSRYDFMQAIVKNGYRDLRVNTDGAVPIYELRHIQNRDYYQFRRKLEYELLKKMIEDADDLP